MSSTDPFTFRTKSKDPFIYQRIVCSCWKRFNASTSRWRKGHRVKFSSKLLNKTQRNYTVTEIEFYSIICALEKFYTFLIDLEFFVITDHRCIAALVKTTNAAGRIARWQIRISPLSFTVLYKPGKENTVADCLSRYPLEESNEPVQYAFILISLAHLSSSNLKINIS